MWGYCSVRLFVCRCLSGLRSKSCFLFLRVVVLSKSCFLLSHEALRLQQCPPFSLPLLVLLSKPCFHFLRGLHCRNLAVLSPCDSVVKILLPAAVLNKAQKARTCAVFVQGNRLWERNFSSERPADEYFMFILVPKPFVSGAFPIASVCPKCRNCRDDICHFACCRLSEAQKTFVWLSFPFVSACRSERHFACCRFK